MSGLKISAILIGFGSILFLVTAFLPISRVYALPTAEKKLAFILQSILAWRVSQLLFFIGSLLVTIGFIIFAFSKSEKPTPLSLNLAAILLFLGLAFWAWHLYLRFLDPVAFAHGALPGWHFQIFIIFSLVAFFLIGLAISGMSFPFWGSWVIMIGATLFFVLFIIFKDLPPFALYLLGMIFSYLLLKSG